MKKTFTEAELHEMKIDGIAHIISAVFLILAYICLVVLY